MIRRALLPIAFSVLALAIPAGGVTAMDDVQSTPPGIDTARPGLIKTYLGCGVYEFEATEITNIPDPPRNPPLATDQVDRGIASITMSSQPASQNAKLTLITDQSFPKDPSYKRFKFRVEPIDKTKRATAFIFVRDWAEPNSNVTTQEIIIEPAVPTVSEDNVTMTGRANTTVTHTITIRNTTSEPQTISAISISGSPLFVLQSGGTATSITLAPGETRTVVISYTPNVNSEAGDAAQVLMTTPCGDKTIPVNGTGTVGRLATTDWAAGNIMIGVQTCLDAGFTITNNGSADVNITDITVTVPNADFTFNLTEPTLPTTLAANGGTVQVKTLCITPSDSHAIAATVSVQSNAEAGDLDCVVTANGVTNSLDPEIMTRLAVRFDASANVVRYNSEARAQLVDVRGNVVAAAGEGARMIGADACAPGDRKSVV